MTARKPLAERIPAIIRAAGSNTPFMPTWRSNKNDEATDMMRGRSHFYDASTLDFFKCSVSRVAAVLHGAAMTGVMSQARGFSDSTRVWRYAIHDFTGHALHEDEYAGDYSTREHAEKALAVALSKLDAMSIVRDAIGRKMREAERELREIRAAAKMLPRKRKAVQS